MNEDNVAHSHNGILVNLKKQWYFAICNKMDGTGESYAKWSKPGPERQIWRKYEFPNDVKRLKQSEV